MSESIDALKEYVREADWVTRSYFAVGIIILLERVILVGELNDDFGGTDWLRWFLLTLTVPVIVILFGVLSNLNRGREQTTQESIFETLALTVFIVISASFLITVGGVGGTINNVPVASFAVGAMLASTIISAYIVIIIFLAIYAIVSLMK